jgi:ABC-type sugar transport system substrate-binding protein
MIRRIVLSILIFSFLNALVIAQSGKNNTNPRKITIGLIGKMGNNPVFQAAYSGARVAAKELGAKRKVQIVIDWQTPPEEDVQEQAAAIERLSHSGANGIAIACTDANYLTPIINKTIDEGTPIMCFDSDAICVLWRR